MHYFVDGVHWGRRMLKKKVVLSWQQNAGGWKRMYVWWPHVYSESMDQPVNVANPARGQLNREDEYFPVRVRAWEFGFAGRVRQSRPASACSSPYSGWIWCLLRRLRDSFRFSQRRSFIYFRPPYPIGSVPSFYRVTQLRTDDVRCRDSAGTRSPPVVLKVVPNECSLGRSPWSNWYAPLFHTPAIGMKWACWKYRRYHAPISFFYLSTSLKLKHLNASRPSDHPPVRGKICPTLR